jgi:hypothetical protein
MRKNLLALSIAAMIGGVSGFANAAVFDSAVTVTGGTGGTDLTKAAVSADKLAPTVTGVGHILTIPYFSTQGGNATLLNITNTDVTNGKAVKLRFRGAANSDDVFDITVFLSPGDVWSAAVSASGNLSALSTTDTSCTLPSIAQIKEEGGLFKTNRVNPANGAAETREGYVEILNTADIPEGSNLFKAIKHDAGKAPCTSSVMDLQDAELVKDDLANSPGARGYSWPTGGLYANWIIVNTTDKASFSGEAVAIRAEKNGANAAGNLVWFPQTADAPSYATSTDTNNPVAGFTADPLLQSTGFKAEVANYDFPDLSTPYTTGLAITAAGTALQATNLANALATKSVVNDYLVGGGASFTTDWVFSMPTRRYAVAVDYAKKGLVFNKAAVAAPGVTATTGVVDHFTDVNTSLNASTLQACVIPGGAMKGYSREEDTQGSFVISPDSALKLCGETTVLTFGTEKVLKAAIASRNVKVNYAEGWLNISTNGLNKGLPVIGFAATKAAGATNLGGTWTHRTSK